jgi:hypothetical protein
MINAQSHTIDAEPPATRNATAPAETQTLCVSLGEFQRAILGHMSQSEACAEERALLRAIDSYLDHRAIRGAGWKFPKFLDDLPPGAPGGPALVVDLPRGLWRRLSAECRRQDVDPDPLIGHALSFAVAAQDRRRSFV